MKIKYDNGGGDGRPDEFIGIASCCHKILTSITSFKEIKISDRGFIFLLPSMREIRFCPFCGKKIERININD